MSEAADKRLYRIANSEPDFYTAKNQSGRQMLVGVRSSDDIIAIYFDRGGQCVGSEIRSIPRNMSDDRHVYGPQFINAVKDAVLKLWKETGYHEARIQVLKFNHNGYQIEDLPTTYQDFVDNPSLAEMNGQKWPEWREAIKDWKERGMFVLWWGKEYWMDEEGEVDST